MIVANERQQFFAGSRQVTMLHREVRMGGRESCRISVSLLPPPDLEDRLHQQEVAVGSPELIAVKPVHQMKTAIYPVLKSVFLETARQNKSNDVAEGTSALHESNGQSAPLSKRGLPIVKIGPCRRGGFQLKKSAFLTSRSVARGPSRSVSPRQQVQKTRLGARFEEDVEVGETTPLGSTARSVRQAPAT